MIMIKGYQTEILKIYENIRTEETRALKKRKDEIQKKYPEIMDMDYKIQKLNLKMSLAALKSSDGRKVIEEFRNQIQNLQIEKCEMLVSHGYPADYLALKYRCPKCQDTGFIGTNKCRCYKDKLIQLYYKDSELSLAVHDNNFSKFKIEYFSSKGSRSPRKNMEEILKYIRGDYLYDFENNTDNLLFYGPPGSGKTFLSYCIAKELLDNGRLVIYKTADELFENLKDIKFNNNTSLESLLVDCDLLIIDDLGAEYQNEFTSAELFILLNKKILKKKKMLISTNLGLPEIATFYSERTSSRLLGEFRIFKFSNEDLRLKSNLKRNRN